MPTTVETGAGLHNLSYNELIGWINIVTEGNADLDKWVEVSAQYGVDEIQAVEDFAEIYMNFYKNGDGTYGITSFNNRVQTSNVSPIDSNISTISRGNVQTPLNRALDSVTNKLNITRFPAAGSFTQKAQYVLGSVGSAFTAASVGIGLGKLIDSALYNLNPNYWDSIGMSTLNPAYWNSITNGDNSWQAGLFNTILGIDPDTGNSQLYIDENAYAYMAYALAQNGWFDSEGYVFPDTSTIVNNTVTVSNSLNLEQFFNLLEQNYVGGFDWDNSVISKSGLLSLIEANWTITDDTLFGGSVSLATGAHPAGSGGFVIRMCNTAKKGDTLTLSESDGIYYYRESRCPRMSLVTVRPAEGAPSRITDWNFSSNSGFNIPYPPQVISGYFYATSFNIVEGQSIEGVSNQDGATLPDTSSWTDIPSTLQSLKQQYPNVFNNPLVWDNVQPDGTNPQLRYVTVPMPNISNPLSDSPVADGSVQNQQQTVIQPSIDPQTLIDELVKIVTQPNPQIEPATDTDTPTPPPQNPVDVGQGSSPTPVAPSGSASALWSVYHPTQAQVNSFGGWLWSTDFVDQLLKVFQNPMDAIISLHKVFITPIDAGTSTIRAGYLDSGVSSNYVTQQYVYADCGYVDCHEQFGNVFDYVGTSVSLYLPFIGIVPLNVEEVMRSTIHVKYGCDLFTGAILAEVYVKRDGNDVILYQYGGDGGVQYPISGSRSSGFLTGLAATIGAAASVATGGAALPAIGAAVGGSVMSASKQVQHSGGFSGNSGAMGVKKPYLIIERPQTKVAQTFPLLAGYPTNYSCKLGDCNNHVVVKHVHIEGINATDSELSMIDSILKSGVIV